MNKKFFIGLVVAVYFVPFLVSKNTLIETTHAAETPEAVMPPGWALYSEVLTAALNGPRYPVIMSPEIKKAFSVYEEQLVAVVEEVEEAKVRQEASVPDIEGNTVTETKREPLSNRKVKYSKPRTFASGSSSTPTPAEPTPAESGTEVPAEPTPAESAEPAEPAEPEVPVVEKEPVDPVVPPRVTVEEAKERAGEFTNEIEGEKFIYNSGSETPQGNRQEKKTDTIYKTGSVSVPEQAPVQPENKEPEVIKEIYSKGSTEDQKVAPVQEEKPIFRTGSTE